MLPKIGIITINRNGIEDTRECLDSLVSNSYESKEIIVVDNASENNEGENLLGEYGTQGVHLIMNTENRGFAGGCNDGIKKAQQLGCDYMLLFNNDAVAKIGFLERLVEEAEKDRKIGIIGPAITYYKSDILWFAGGIIGERTGIFRHKWKKKDKKILKGLEPYETEYVSGCCMMIKKKLLDEQGLLDEDYFAYYEEADYCYRARKQGWKCIIAPDVTIEHKKSASVGNEGSDKLSKNQAYLLSRNGIMFGKKNFTGFIRIWYETMQFSLRALYNILLTIDDREVFKSYLRGLRDGRK